MRKLALILFTLIVGCATVQEKNFEKTYEEVVTFRDEMSQEFFAAFNVFKRNTSTASVAGMHVRRIMVTYMILMDEVNACLDGARKLQKLGVNPDTELSCAKKTINEALALIRFLGVEPEEEDTPSVGGGTVSDN